MEYLKLAQLQLNLKGFNTTNVSVEYLQMELHRQLIQGFNTTNVSVEFYQFELQYLLFFVFQYYKCIGGIWLRDIIT